MIGSYTIRGDNTYSLIGGDYSFERNALESDICMAKVLIFSEKASCQLQPFHTGSAQKGIESTPGVA